MTVTSRLEWIVRGLVALVLLAAMGGTAYAQPQAGACPGTYDLSTNIMAQIVSNGNGITRGEILLTDDQRALPGTVTASGTYNCVRQLLRHFDIPGHVAPTSPGAIAPLPQVGPIVRANIGDVVELTMLNQVNPLDYGKTIDSGEISGACDTFSANGYPNVGTNPFTSKPIDTYPDCFHGSTTANMHYHGTHTSPTSAADNVYVAVTPSPRTPSGAPFITNATFAADTAAFFKACEAALRTNPLNQFPVSPAAFGKLPTNQAEINRWIAGPTPPSTAPYWQKQFWYMNQVGQNWRNINLVQIDSAELLATPPQWASYYAGTFPNCFILPRYNPAKTPNLMMGQAPGTHWYHAHKHGATAINVFNGMAGALIVEDNSPAILPGGPPGYDYYFNNGSTVFAGLAGQYVFEGYNKFRNQLTKVAPDGKVVAFDTKATWSSQQPVLIIDEFTNTMPLEGGNGAFNQLSVNGMPSGNVFKVGTSVSARTQASATMTMQPGAVMLWRIVNASPIQGFLITADSFPKGFTWQQTAQDGVQFNDENYRARKQHAVFVAPGNRIDVLVRAPSGADVPAGSVPFNVAFGKSEPNALKNLTTQTVPLFNISVKGRPVAGMDLPQHLAPRPPFLTDIDTTKLPIDRSIVFNTSGPGGGRVHTINGGQFDPNLPNAQETIHLEKLPGGALKKTEQWLIVNTTTVGGIVDHPFHIHINPFQVTSVFDPNAFLTNKNGQPDVSTPLYVFDTTVPNDAPSRSAYWVTSNGFYTGQCKVNPTPVPGMQMPKPPQAPPGSTWTAPPWNPTWVQCDAPPSGTQVTIPPPPPAKQISNIWWDVFPIPAANASNNVPGYFTMASNFVDYLGEYVLHCHILAHEDRGMMMTVATVAGDCQGPNCVSASMPHVHHH